jgi:RNA polymerase-binding transcription factor DksA
VSAREDHGARRRITIVDSHLEIAAPPLFTVDELAVLRRRLLAKGRELSEILAALMAGLSPKATDLLDACPGETKIEKVRRYLDLVDRKIKAIAAGNYGRCEGCDAPIPPALLAELPWMDRCPACAASA